MFRFHDFENVILHSRAYVLGGDKTVISFLKRSRSFIDFAFKLDFCKCYPLF